jgi:hypothetical protein
MIYIFVALLLNNHVLVNYSNINETNIPNLKEILEEIETNDIMDVDKTVKKYMLTHGIDKVRGGSYKNDILEDWQIKSLEHELKLLKPNNEVSKLDEFINTYNSSNIDDTINHIIHFRKRLLKLKEMDRMTDFNFNLDNIIIALDKKNKIIKLREEFQKYYNLYPSQRQRNIDSITTNKMIKIEQDIKELNEEINKLSNRPFFNNIIMEIGTAYSQYLIYTDNSPDSDYIIQLYSTKIFNTEIKQKIKDFKSPFGSTEEEILEKYQALLKHKLSLIQTN